MGDARVPRAGERPQRQEVPVVEQELARQLRAEVAPLSGSAGDWSPTVELQLVDEPVARLGLVGHVAGLDGGLEPFRIAEGAYRQRGRGARRAAPRACQIACEQTDTKGL